MDFAALVRQHQNAVCATAYAVLRDRARSEDIAQDAFLIAWRKLPAEPTPPPLPAWICGIARNLARNAARKAREVAMPSPIDPPSETTPLDEALSREQAQLAESALAAIAEVDREVLVLYYRGEQSLADVAVILGVSEATAKQRLHRGRERLKTAVAVVAAMLRASRPTAAFTASCVAALGAGRIPEADAATDAGTQAASTTSSPVAALVGILAVVVTAIVAVVVVARRHVSDEALVVSKPEVRREDASIALPADAPGASTDRAVPPVAATRPRSALPQIAPAARQALIDRAPSGTPSKVYDFAGSALAELAPPPTPRPTGPLSKSTLRYALGDLQPLLAECAMHHPQAHGTLAITLRLVGDPEATVVDTVEVAGRDAADDLLECMRETLYTVELPPMAAAETWDVIYPLAL